VSILKLLVLVLEGGDDARGVSETGTVRHIVAELDQLEPERANYIAAFAYILSRAALADMQISDDETRAMERIVVDHGQIPEEQAIIVVQMAKTRNKLFGGTENFPVTREFNEMTTRGQKLALLDCLFAVAAADLSISSHEDRVIRQIANELLLEHRDFIDLRSRYRDHLSVFQDSDED
jgi:uncharacterized tellurite resistance protein B-like protein